MAIRISQSYVIFAILWGLLAVLQVGTENIRNLFPHYIGIALMIAGISFGIGYGIILTRRVLGSLEMKGEFQASISQILIIIGVILVFGGIVFLFSGQIQFEMITAFYDFFVLFAPAFFVTQIFLLRRWENKHNKIILQGTWGGKIYLSP